MVDERTTDGERIAQLLASELSGLDVGPLADVTVTDANPDATPAESGALAYAIAYEGERVGEVSLYPDRARIGLAVPADRRPDDGHDIVAVCEDNGCEFDAVVTVDSGAAVKRAVDAVRELLVLSDRNPDDGT